MIRATFTTVLIATGFLTLFSAAAALGAMLAGP